MSSIVFLFRWHVRKNNRDEPIEPKSTYTSSQLMMYNNNNHNSHNNKNNFNNVHHNNHNNNDKYRVYVNDGTLIITHVKKADAGSYICTAKNTEGTENLEVQLDVTSPLTVHIQPASQTIDLGKSTELVVFHLSFIMLLN